MRVEVAWRNRCFENKSNQPIILRSSAIEGSKEDVSVSLGAGKTLLCNKLEKVTKEVSESNLEEIGK